VKVLYGVRSVNGSYELRDLKASYDPPFTLKNIDLSADQYWDVSD
jgi:hypothetical protein